MPSSDETICAGGVRDVPMYVEVVATPGIFQDRAFVCNSLKHKPKYFSAVDAMPSIDHLYIICVASDGCLLLTMCSIFWKVSSYYVMVYLKVFSRVFT